MGGIRWIYMDQSVAIPREVEAQRPDHDNDKEDERIEACPQPVEVCEEKLDRLHHEAIDKALCLQGEDNSTHEDDGHPD